MNARFNLKTLLTLIVFVFAINANKAKAQEGFASVTDSLANELEMVKSDVSKLKKLKISGYIQAQYQTADSIPGKFIGGDFTDANGGIQANRFKIRRGRIKFAYETELAQFVMQFDVSEGGLSTKDIYGKFTEPFLKAFSLTTGIFNRPFGYEIEYSSSARETPERSRFTQTLFPGERDLGGMLTFQPAKGTPYDFIRIQAGMFAGNGMAAETHTNRDYIGRAGISKSAMDEKIKFGAGVSYYNGGVFVGSKDFKTAPTVYTSNGKAGFTASTVIDNRNSYAKRQYTGVDGQFSVATPFGLSGLRAEYVWGVQSSADQIYGASPSTNARIDGPVYTRNMNGYYVNFVQNLLNSKHSLVVKYDVYDPNTDVEGKDIKAANDDKSATNFSLADVKFSTLGLGYIFNLDANVKISAYYEMPKNEQTGLKGSIDVIKGNSFTLRFQYKF